MATVSRRICTQRTEIVQMSMKRLLIMHWEFKSLTFFFILYLAKLVETFQLKQMEICMHFAWADYFNGLKMEDIMECSDKRIREFYFFSLWHYHPSPTSLNLIREWVAIVSLCQSFRFDDCNINWL